MKLKASVPGSNVIEVQFVDAPESWETALNALPGVESVHHEGAGMFRILSNAASTVKALVEASLSADIKIKTLSAQSTTLDDVFVHYTGRQLRDDLVKAKEFIMPTRPGY